MKEKIKEVPRANNELLAELECESSEEEVAERLGWLIDKVRFVASAMPDAVSLDMPVGAEETARIGDFVEDERASDVASELVPGRKSEHLCLAVLRLPERERHVLVRRYVPDDRENVSIAELSMKSGMSRKRVSKL